VQGSDHLDHGAQDPPSGPTEVAGTNSLSGNAPSFTPIEASASSSDPNSYADEVEAAAQWWSRSMSQQNLAQSQVNAFEKSLKAAMSERCNGHWYPSDPTRGSGHRSTMSSVTVDPILVSAAQAAGIRDIVTRLPKCIVWVNPGVVRIQLEEERHACTIFSTAAKSPSKAPGSSESDDGSCDS
jgi:hypothetical protein